MNRKQPIRWLNVVILFCVIVQGLLIYGAVATVQLNERKAHEATFLPVEARISAVAVRVRSVGSRGSTTLYGPVVSFRYPVDGKEYEASAVGRGLSPSEEEMRKEAQVAYPVGRAIQAFYDPSNPSDAVLERDPPLANLGGFLLGCYGVPFLLLMPGTALGLRRLIQWIVGRSKRG